MAHELSIRDLERIAQFKEIQERTGKEHWIAVDWDNDYRIKYAIQLDGEYNNYKRYRYWPDGYSAPLTFTDFYMDEVHALLNPKDEETEPEQAKAKGERN